MVYLENWDEFASQAEQLFRNDPAQFRYCMKYRHRDGALVVKATDNKQCLKFKTDQVQDAKKMEKLNSLFFTLMAAGPDAEIPIDQPQEPAQPQTGRKGRRRRQ